MKQYISLVTMFLIETALLFASPVSAKENCAVLNDQLSVNLLPAMHYFEDVDHRASEPWADTSIIFEYLGAGGEIYNFGANDHSHWLRFCIVNHLRKEQSVVLAFGPPLLTEFDFIPRNVGRQAFYTGGARRFDTRDIYHPAYHFDVRLSAGEKAVFYVRFRALRNAFISAKAWREDAYAIQADKVLGLYGIFAGVFLGLILYNLMLFLTTKQYSSLWYIAFATSVFCVIAFFDGRMLQYVFPSSPALALKINEANYLLISIFGALFCRSFMKISRYPVLDRVGIFLLAAFVGIIALSYYYDSALYLRLCTALTIFGTVYFGIICSVYALSQGSIEARYYLLGNIPFMLTIFERGLYNLGVIETYFLPYEPKVGLASCMILLAYGVGRTIFKDKALAQELALEQLELANSLKAKYNTELKREIDENTAEIREMNKSLAAQTEQLRELDNIKSRFFANISHEFRTPLTLIQGPLIAQAQSKGPVDKHVLMGAVRQAEQLRRLIDQLLSLSSFDNDSARLQAAEVELVSTVRRITLQFSSLALQVNVELRFETDEEQVLAYVDIDKFEIVMNNLLSNALKFTPEGGRVTVELSVRGVPDSEANNDLRAVSGIQIDVRDSGEGIEEADLSHIFDRYYQSQAGAGQSGTGIGLALVKEIVELHRGQVSVSSIARVGSCFTLSLPSGRDWLKPDQYAIENSTERTDFANESSLSALSDEELNHDDRQGEDNPHAGAKLLIVDDNCDMREYLKSLLDGSYTIVEAANGLAAERVLRAEPPALIITDLMMPKRDGIAFIESIKEDAAYRCIPVIVLTAKAGREDKLRGLAALADDYLAKPFDAVELKARIKNLLGKSQSWQVKLEQDKQPVDTPGRSIVTRARALVLEHLADDSFGVEELARALCVSAPTLRRRIAEVSDFTPSSLIRHYRLESARAYVQEGRFETLDSLAAAVGFNQANYFSRLYRKTYNEDPVVRPVVADTPAAADID